MTFVLTLHVSIFKTQHRKITQVAGAKKFRNIYFTRSGLPNPDRRDEPSSSLSQIEAFGRLRGDRERADFGKPLCAPQSEDKGSYPAPSVRQCRRSPESLRSIHRSLRIPPTQCPLDGFRAAPLYQGTRVHPAVPPKTTAP